MIFDDLLAYCQPDPGTFIFIIMVKPLKEVENMISIMLVKANSIVLN